MAKKKKEKNNKTPRIPVIIWKIFQKRARTLGDTVLAITGKCRCKRQRCLSCGGVEAMSYLLRPEDPPDYRRLVSKSFAVVSENAPPIPRFDPQSHWPQREIVTRTIEMIMHDQPSSQNLLCNGYNKVKHSSAVVNILTSSAWSLLLRRVGDTLMIYLLKYTSIFLPLPRNNFQQIAGFPISDLYSKFSRDIPDPQTQQQPFAHQGLVKKRKRVEGIESTSAKRPHVGSMGSQPSSCSGFASKNGDELTQSAREADGRSNQDNVLPRKHKRQYRWQRLRKHRQLSMINTSVTMNSENCSNSDMFSRGLQDGLNVDSGQEFATDLSDYPCSTGFHNIQRMSRNSEIDRRNIFYRLETSASMFPKKHILYALRPNNSGAIFLFKSIFGTSDGDKNLLSEPCLHSKCTCHIRSTCLYRSFIKLLKSLISNTRTCPYLKLLEKHCPGTRSCSVTNSGPSSMSEGNDSENSSLGGCAEAPTEGKSFHVAYAKNCKRIPGATAVHTEPSNSYCPKKQVASFIWAICRRIIPSPLLGEPSTQRVLRSNISKFIHLRKFEKFSLKDCMHKLKLLKFPLLSKIHCGCSKLGISDLVRHAVFDRWVFWLFASVVSPLVQANFYVTESEHVKQDILYYHKSTWEKLMREAQKCLKDQSYHQLSHVALREILINRRFGFSRARLRPKNFGFRVLANLQAPSRLRVNLPLSKIHVYQESQNQATCHSRDAKYTFFKSVNSVLRDSHVVLSGLRTTEPEKLGSSVFDYNDVYRKLVPFLFHLKNRSSTMPAVYIVVSDVSKAFDSVDQKKLLSVMKDVLLDNEYTLEKSVQVIRTQKSLKVHRQHILAHQDTGANSLGIRSQPGHALDIILIKKELSRIIKGSDLNAILKEHTTRNVVKIHGNFYLQKVGIPQGSVLSTLLCSYYYGHMERTVVFPFLEKSRENLLVKIDSHQSQASEENHADKMLVLASEYLLLRFVDDYVLITTSEKQASAFFSRLERGVRDYNCYMNKEKYGLNFDINDGDGTRSERVYVGKDGVSFLRWSGLLINSHTVEVQADYTRYLNSHLHTTVTVTRQGKVGCHLKVKLRDYLRPKCHPMFYDSNINSPSVVRLNIYQVFLLCAMKFICYISKLSTITKFSPEFYFKAIAASLRYMNRLIKRRMYSRLSGMTHRPRYDVKNGEIMWLGFYAYTQVLKKKQSRYKDLLGLFMTKLKTYQKVENMPSELKYAVDASHSSALWKIKY